MSFAVTIRAKSNGVLDCIFAAFSQSYSVMNFKKWTSIGFSFEWSFLFTTFTNSVCAIQNHYDDIWISAEADRNNLHSLGNLRSVAQSTLKCCRIEIL